MTLKLAQTDEANQLISADPFALLVGMILDQQIPLERAFQAPYELRSRLDGELSVEVIAHSNPDELIAVFCRQPALHRFPAANAKRVQKMAEIVLDEYDGRADAIWTDAATGEELVRRVAALPGFGAQKAKIFVALLGKQLKVRPPGWKEACSPFGEPKTTMSIADINSDKSLQAVRAWKQARKAAAKVEADKSLKPT